LPITTPGRAEKDGDPGILCRPLDQNAPDGSVLQALLQELADFDVVVEHRGKILVARVPT
jgi:hypothetical protein